MNAYLALIPFLVIPQLHAAEPATLDPVPAKPAPATPAAAEAPATAPMDMGERRASVATLRSHVEMREKRFAEITGEIRALDERNEKRIDSLVEMLTGLKDSESTKVRLNTLKEDAIRSLRKGIDIYVTKRRDLLERLRVDKNAPVEELSGDMAKFDARIQKRVDQIIELVKSMPERKDVDKYESAGGTYWDGFYQENERISDEFKQNRRQGVATETTQRDVRAELQKAVVAEESRLRAAKEKVANQKLSSQEKDALTAEAKRIEERLESRRKELLELAAPNQEESAENVEPGVDDFKTSTGNTPAPATREVSPDQVEVIKDMLDDARTDISRDFWNVIGKYSEAVKEREKIIALKANLKAREDWLAEHDKSAK